MNIQMIEVVTTIKSDPTKKVEEGRSNHKNVNEQMLILKSL